MVGGFVAHYASWRVMQLILAIAATFLYILMYCLLPETSQPRARGIDKLFEAEGALGDKRCRWIWLNPFSDLALLRSPNILAVVGPFLIYERQKLELISVVPGSDVLPHLRLWSVHFLRPAISVPLNIAAYLVLLIPLAFTIVSLLLMLRLCARF
jgi:hypothetical protein